jgi:cysteine-S-conjugate beta-lyase
MAVQTTYNFNEIIDRRHSDSGKWNAYPADVIPMWTADMDFRSAPPILEALHARVEHGVFGYTYSPWSNFRPTELLDVLVARMDQRYGWQLTPEDFTFVPNLVSALFGVCRTCGMDEVSILTPNYWPFFSGAEAANRPITMTPMVPVRNGDHLRYEIDFDALEASITPQTTLFLLCNPHNPVGRTYTRPELEGIAEICLRHGLIICADEIHCDLVYDGHQHIPMASLSPEIADRCITLMAASKSFNLPGLKLGFMIAQNAELRESVHQFYAQTGVGTNIMGYTATLAAYRDSHDWLESLLDYLRANRDYALDYVNQHLPGITATCPEATYLMFLDCREAAIAGDPTDFFLEQGRVALSGHWDNQGFAGHTRLNYGCPRSQLAEALDRMRQALTGH